MPDAGRADFEVWGLLEEGIILDAQVWNCLVKLCFFPRRSLIPSRRSVPPRSLAHHLHEPVMLNPLKFLRYFIFVVFVICNAIITSVAVWNLSIVQSSPGAVGTKQIDAYLIFTGALGLLIIFPIIFCDLCRSNVFLVKVWFELLWVGTFWIMQLIGAAAITSLSSSCASLLGDVPSSISSQESPCASTQVLQAFTWTSAILLLGYFTLLSTLTYVKQRDDPTIWQCNVRRFPLVTHRRTLKSVPTSPSVPRFRTKSPPIIAAPRPHRIVQLREDILNHRSGLSLEYEIEHYQAPEPEATGEPTSFDGHASPVRSQAASPPFPPLQPVQQPSPVQQPIHDTPFYHSAVRTVIDKDASQPQQPPAARLASIRRLPPSPPPLGDWPRLDATSRPRSKRKPLPQPRVSDEADLQRPQPQASSSQPHPLPPPPRPQASLSAPLHQPPAQASMQPPTSQSRALPAHPQPPPPVATYTFDAPALAAALQPLASSSESAWRSSKSRPGGPRRRSSSIDDGRPAALDLSNISSFRSPGFRQ